jgi:hypothetical protein
MRYAWDRTGENVFTGLVGNSEGKKSLGRSMRRWKIGIRMNLEETGWRWGCGVNSVGLG